MTSTPGSPSSKVKFLCSHGGKILPRPADGTLKYVGGETRVVSVPRDVNFAELVKKLATLTDGETVLKYQLLTEDLDSLVTVKSDEDLRYMLDEYDRHEASGTHMLRAFLFPVNPLLVDTCSQTSPSKEPQAIEQRYLDAINGIIRATSATGRQSSNYPSPFCPSSACSSPRSPESSSIHHGNYDVVQTHMHKVQSSPSISSLSNQQHHQNPYLQNYHQTQHHGFQSPSPQRDGLVSWKYQLSPGGGYGQPVGGVHGKENGCYCNNCLKLDEYRKIMAAEGVSWSSPPYGRSPS